MTSRYILAPQAAQDLVDIWRSRKSKQHSRSRSSGVGYSGQDCISIWSPKHWTLAERSNWNAVKFFAVYSYLIVYRPDTKPLQVVSILHGRRDVETVLRSRL